jgi:rhamnogalacturonan acetylesterase
MRQFALAWALLGMVAAANAAEEKPTLWIVGDSTVRNGTKGQVGWGDPIARHFDADKIVVKNRALGGRSSRSFQAEGLWDRVLGEIKAGDFVLIQFGHNDGGPLAGDNRERGSTRGTGEESKEVTLTLKPRAGQKEVVHTYGWYMRKYVTDAKTKGAIPIVVSPVPRNIFQDGKVARSSNSYGKWAEESARAAGAFFIDLHELVARRYEQDGAEKVKAEYFQEDHTHTTAKGAEVTAAILAEAIGELKDCPLRNYLRDQRR